MFTQSKLIYLEKELRIILTAIFQSINYFIIEFFFKNGYLFIVLRLFSYAKVLKISCLLKNEIGYSEGSLPQFHFPLRFYNPL